MSAARPAPERQVHGTCVALGRTGVLIRGPSGSGKSDLALRLIDEGAVLVADDRVVLRRDAGRVTARAPETLAGLLEVRGLGIVRLAHRRRAALGLVVDLAAAGIERLPRAATCSLLGLALPRIRLDARQASAPAKLRLALSARRAEI
ncbi:MAG: HPr kinase/phosphatase C-terminal domain-containing protein [Alphaproteobacteria bacterium]